MPRRGRRFHLESLEERRLMAGDVAPQVLLGSVYFEEATGDDSQADVIQVSFEGGAAGTTLNRLVIDGDKDGLGLSTGDVFFDTEAGGLGAFGDVGFSIVSHDGFTVTSVAVVDGGTKIEFTFSGFDAGEIFSFSLDADEAQFVGGSDVDTNALVEGAEFQRSKITGTFVAPHYVDLDAQRHVLGRLQRQLRRRADCHRSDARFAERRVRAESRLHGSHGRRSGVRRPDSAGHDFRLGLPRPR